MGSGPGTHDLGLGRVELMTSAAGHTTSPQADAVETPR